MSGDPYWYDVLLLVQMNGADEGTTFVDSSTHTKTVTAYNGAKTDTAQSVYGGSSGYLDGIDDYLLIADATQFTLPGDFTIEWLDRPELVSGERPILDGRDVDGFYPFYIAYAEGHINAIFDTNYILATSVITVNTDVWGHRAICRSGDTIMAFSNGIKDPVTIGVAGPITLTGSNIYVGRNVDGDAFSKTWICGLRITKQCRYTDNFTVPDLPFSTFGLGEDEQLSINDALGNTRETLVPLVDAIGFSDIIGVSWEILAAIDSFAISDAAEAFLTLSATTDDALIISDSINSLQLAFAADTLGIADALSFTTYSLLAAVDTLTIADSSTTTLFVSAYDTLSITDSVTVVLTLYAATADTLAISDFISDNATNLQRIVVMNLDTGAISEYVLPMVVTGMAQRNGVLYLTTSDGLFALDATTDDGDSITWHWRTGLTHLGSDQVKRPIDLNILGRVEGTAIAEVVTVQEGAKRIDYYPIPNMTRSAHRDAIVKPGKGLNSVYWSFGEQGTGPAERHECRASMWILKRRR